MEKAVRANKTNQLTKIVFGRTLNSNFVNGQCKFAIGMG